MRKWSSLGSFVAWLCAVTRRAKIAPLANDYKELSAEELLSACANLGDIRAWEEFIRRFHIVVHATVARTARRYLTDPRTLSDDLEQEVFVKFSANGGEVLRRFAPRDPGSAFGYVKVIAARVVHDYFRSQQSKGLQEPAASAESIPATDDVDRRMIVRDIDDFLRKDANERDRQIFWLYYVNGMTAREIAALPGIEINAKGVESVLVRLGRSIRQFLGRGEGKARGTDVS